jgi:hypothetical protein
VALFIILLVVGAFGTAFWIHKSTYRSPRDVTAPYRKQEKTKTGGTVAVITPQRFSRPPCTGVRSGPARVRGR